MCWVNCCISEKCNFLLSYSVSFMYFLLASFLCSLTVTYSCVFSICFDGMLNWNCSDSDFASLYNHVCVFLCEKATILFCLQEIKANPSGFLALFHAQNAKKKKKEEILTCFYCSFELNANVRLVLGFLPEGLGVKTISFMRHLTAHFPAVLCCFMLCRGEWGLSPCCGVSAGAGEGTERA